MRRRSLWSVLAVTATSVTAVGLAAVSPAAAAEPPGGFTDAAIAAADRPTAVEWLPSDQIVVLEQGGRVRIAEPGAAFTTALTLSAICTNSERGLLGFTPDPAFSSNGHVYVYYTHSVADGCVNRVSRFTLSGSTIDPATEVVLLDNIASTGGNHNGGDLDVGSDGYLYVSVGDAGQDPRGRSGRNPAAQDPSLLNGKILRITRDGRPAPAFGLATGDTDCATLGTSAPTSARCREIFAKGLRNPYRIAFDRNDGRSRFFINDVGQSTYEEVDYGMPENYGWPDWEGDCPRGETAPCAKTPEHLIGPETSYGRDLGTYITAGAFVPNGMWPKRYDGAYLFADGGSGRIWMRAADGSVDYGAPFATGAFGITDMTFGFDSAGDLVVYYVTIGGGLRVITPTTMKAQAPDADLKMVPVEPFRAYDTADDTGGAPGVVFNGTTRLVDLDPPGGATAALVNLTYDQTSGPGYLRSWRARTRRPATSSLNADRPTTLAANATVVALDGDGAFVIETTTTARVVVDVMAWFEPTTGTTDGRYVALDPGRVVDTRIAAGTALGSGSANPYRRVPDQIDIDVLEHPGVPDDGTVGAIVVSVGAVAGDADGGYVGGFQGGTPYRGTSNVNVRRGEIRANMMVVPIGSVGTISLRVQGIADVVVDVLGYITSEDAPASTAGLYQSITPTRVVDSRVPLGFSSLEALQAKSVAIPRAASGAAAVVQNITATDTTGAGWISAHPGAVAPEVSSVNYDRPGQIRAALAFTTVSSTDTVSFTSKVATDLVVDVVGYFSD